MLRRFLLPLCLILAVTALPGGWSAKAGSGSHIYLPAMSNNPLRPPLLQWVYAGCKSSSCEWGWFSSPAVVDINGDGKKEVIAASHSVRAFDGQTGATLWSSYAPGDRTSPPVAVADIDRDGAQEIVAAQWGGWVSVFNLGGALKWQKQIVFPEDTNNPAAELRDVLLTDLDGNNSPLEVIIGRGERGGANGTNTWVLDSSGNLRGGWPQQVSRSLGYSSGIYNASIAAGDIDGDGKQEVIVPSDMHYINVYRPDGSPVKANQAVFPGLNWGQVGVWENPQAERDSKLRDCYDPSLTRVGHYRSNFAYGPAVITDVDNDGTREVVVTGNMYDCTKTYPPSQYIPLYIFNADRTRYSKPGADWNIIPLDTGTPLSEEDSKVIRSIRPSPAVVDIDGDGKKEILFPSYDGRLHAFWLDKTEHGGWPFAVTKPGDGFIQFASEPAIADLDNDGKAEIIFTSWTQVGSNHWGKLYILSWDGYPLFEVDLPVPLNTRDGWGGNMAAPTLANIDNDPNLEVVLNTALSGVVTYELPGTANARILWGTGRGNFARTGAQ